MKTTTEINETLVNKILHLFSFGLTKGLGKPKEGQMCIEAAICFAQGLPHSDKPTCVGDEVNKCKIALNDCNWSSNQARAKGMKKIGIAQLGSDTLGQKEFYNLLKLKSIQKILPFIIQKHYEKVKDEKLLKYKFKFENSLNLDIELWENFYNDYYYYYYHYYNYNNYYHYHYYNNYYNFGDEFLLIVADTILQTLIQMNSPGCKFLHLVK